MIHMVKQMKNVFLGTVSITSDGNDIAFEYLQAAQKDEKAADLLYKNLMYNQSVYFYIQSMEKVIKYYICKKVNVTNNYFALKLRDIGHSLDHAADFYIKIMAGNNDVLYNQLTMQIKYNIFRNIRFSIAYNASRYPYYKEDRSEYRTVTMHKEDCQLLQEINRQLKQYLNEMSIMI